MMQSAYTSLRRSIMAVVKRVPVYRTEREIVAIANEIEALAKKYAADKQRESRAVGL